MKLSRLFLKFLLKFGIVYTLLLLSQLGMGDAYASFFRTAGEKIFGDFGKKGKVLYMPYDDKDNRESRTKIVLMNKEEVALATKKGPDTRIQTADIFSSWYTDYLLVVILVSLILATPLHWKRKLWALLGGLVLIHIYILILGYFLLLYQFKSYPYLKVLDLSPFWNGVVDFVYPLLGANPGTGISVAVLIWLAVCFRKGDWRNLLTEIKTLA